MRIHAQDRGRRRTHGTGTGTGTGDGAVQRMYLGCTAWEALSQGQVLAGLAELVQGPWKPCPAGSTHPSSPDV
jgi:hypothetical protein